MKNIQNDIINYMVKYIDFKGEISVDFEQTPSLSQKLREFSDIILHQDDCIIGIKLSVGEYHHNANRGPYFFLKILTCHKNDASKNPEERKTKEIESSISAENFFKLFKRVGISLWPHNHGYEL